MRISNVAALGIAAGNLSAVEGVSVGFQASLRGVGSPVHTALAADVTPFIIERGTQNYTRTGLSDQLSDAIRVKTDDIKKDLETTFNELSDGLYKDKNYPFKTKADAIDFLEKNEPDPITYYKGGSSRDTGSVVDGRHVYITDIPENNRRDEL